MAVKAYRIKFSRGDVEIEAEGDKAFVLEMLQRYEALSTGSPPPKKEEGRSRHLGEQAEISKAGKTLSVGEFVRQLGFKKHTDIVLAFGYYTELQGAKVFTPADINNCYYEAKMESSNTSQMIISNIRRGYMMEAKGSKSSGRKRYTLTQSGENFIKSGGHKKSA